MESAIVGDKGSTTLRKNGNTKLENNYLCRCQDYSMIDGLYDNTRIAKGGTPLPHPLPRVRKHERIHHHINTYDDWYRLIKATGKFVGSDNKSADYHLEMGYDNLYNITSKKLTMTQTNLQFAGTLSAGHEFSYNYSNDNPMQLASVETKQYNVDGEVSDVDAKLADNQHVQSYEFDANGNMTSVSVASLKPETQEPETTEASEDKDVLKSFLWDEENRLLAVNNNGSVSCYFYDAAGERTVKLTSETEMVHVNGKKVLMNLLIRQGIKKHISIVDLRIKKDRLTKFGKMQKIAKERLKILIQETCYIGTKVNHAMVNGIWNILKQTSIVKNIKIIWMVK